jgi:(p)ppGpp synthase/HD superfamily hydrolase
MPQPGDQSCTPAVPLSTRFTDAFAFAFEVHRGQTKKSTTVPYISHLLEVAGLVLAYGGNEDEAIAALLHDTLEDHPEQATFAEISRRFGERVAAIVLGCSDTTVRPKPDWHKRKRDYIAHLRGADESEVMVAAADKLVNARSVIKDYREVGDEVWKRFNAGRSDQLWYYREVTRALKDAAGNGRARALVGELERAVHELEALCGASSSSD